MATMTNGPSTPLDGRSLTAAWRCRRGTGAWRGRILSRENSPGADALPPTPGRNGARFRPASASAHAGTLVMERSSGSDFTEAWRRSKSALDERKPAINGGRAFG